MALFHVVSLLYVTACVYETPGLYPLQVAEVCEGPASLVAGFQSLLASQEEEIYPEKENVFICLFLGIKVVKGP